jgi:hypothetical protein
LKDAAERFKNSPAAQDFLAAMGRRESASNKPVLYKSVIMLRAEKRLCRE